MLCKLCSGNCGSPNPKTGNHYLCEALAAHNQPTPCLGIKCESCNGSGVKRGFRGGVMLSLDLHPAQIARSIAAQFPPCESCGGKGSTA
jgi:hypothetical protein